MSIRSCGDADPLNRAAAARVPLLMISRTYVRDAAPVAAYVILWAGVLILLKRFCGFQPAEAVAGLLIFGVAFSALAWWTTRRSTPLPDPVRSPVKESVLLIAYLVFAAIVVAYGFGVIGRIGTEPAHRLVLVAVKLALFVFIPAVLLGRMGGYGLSELAPASFRGKALLPALWVGLAALGLQAFLGRGLRDVVNAHIAPAVLAFAVPLCFVFLAVEAGVVEEFFFRALLQERLTALLRRPWAALVLSAVLFGLMHAPGLYLRPGATMENVGAHPSALLAVGYSIVVTSVAGLCLGVLWLRTRNFAAVVLAHAAVDLLPGIVPLVREFHLN